MLARSFFNRTLLKSEKKLDGISKTAMDYLMAYSWPGNARELKSAFEFAFVSCPGGMIEADHLPPQISATPPTRSAVQNPPNESLDDVKRRRLIEALKRANGNQSEAARLLGISRTSVWSQIKKYKLQR
ncbi:MAG: helix-turn-helix domain-containing protein [Desulfobacteraceae bacterium]|jgi:transcriptional regulator of acetoin/glycerol metabolism|nr:helix-turn-helix domain-containing protein [Desulfobacteraceae bacterium]